MREEFLVSWEEEDTRIDRYLSGVCPSFRRSYIQKLLKNGDILVDGQQVKSSYGVK